MLLTLLILLILAGVIAALYFYHIYTTINSEDLSEKDLSINTSLDNQVINIAMFGVDGRDDPDVEGDRSDVIMIGTLNMRDHSVKVTSVMRDTYAKICLPEGNEINADSAYAGDLDGVEWETAEVSESEEVVESPEGGVAAESTERVEIDDENQSWNALYTKINAAYYYGGVEGAIKTINQNFDLNIKDYVTVDFLLLMDAVDALGGISVDIPNEEVLYWTNQYLKESNGFGGRNDPDLTHTGVQTLTGAQALAFARNRYTDSDYGRTQRQREVIQAIFEKARQMDPVTAISLINSVYPHIQTSLSLGQITDYAQAVLTSEDMAFDSFRIPTDEYGAGGYIDGIWYLFPDTLLDNCRALHSFIYGPDNVYTPSSTVTQISQVINDILLYQASDVQHQIGNDPKMTSSSDTSGQTTDTSGSETAQ